jgi:3-(3-hydroxy-phenyl)propionate hydroxylase
MASVLLRRDDARSKALRDTVAELLGMDEPRLRLTAEMSGLGVHYDLGPGHPLLGRRMPDLDLATAQGLTRVYALLRSARPRVLNIAAAGRVARGARAGRVQKLDATTEGPWDLPALGPVPAPAAVLVRPDGHVAWVGEGTSTGLTDALGTWCGQ